MESKVKKEPKAQRVSWNLSPLVSSSPSQSLHESAFSLPFLLSLPSPLPYQSLTLSSTLLSLPSSSLTLLSSSQLPSPDQIKPTKTS